MEPINWSVFVIAAITFVVGIVIGYVVGASSHTQSTAYNDSQEQPATVEQAVEDEEEGWAGTVYITLQGGKSILIECDSVDEYSIEGGSLVLEWNACGMVAVTTAETTTNVETFDTDDEPLVLMYSNVEKVVMKGL